MDAYTQGFSEAWGQFEVSLKGALGEHAKSRPLTLGMANIILKGATAEWLSPYEPAGSWLNQFKKVEPETADIILSIINRKMTFSEIEGQQAGVNPLIKYGIPPPGQSLGCRSQACLLPTP